MYTYATIIVSGTNHISWSVQFLIHLQLILYKHAQCGDSPWTREHYGEFLIFLIHDNSVY